MSKINTSPGSELHCITGAFGYSGRHLALKLLEAGQRLCTLTGHPDRANPFGGKIEAMPFNFDRPGALAASLSGVTVLYNTYWVRFDYGDTTYSRAVEQTKKLIAAAVDAGVERVVHVSITNPRKDSPLPYFKGKAQIEEALEQSGLSYAILRPTVLFGGRDVLINNIAWLLRRLPVFGVTSGGRARIQPIHVDDLAELAIDQGRSRQNVVIDAVGPETFTYLDLVTNVSQAVGSRAMIMKMPRWLVLAAAKFLGWIVHDVVLTAEEVDGLNADLLVSDNPPTGTTKFSEWLDAHALELGREYASELARHYDASPASHSLSNTTPRLRPA